VPSPAADPAPAAGPVSAPRADCGPGGASRADCGPGGASRADYGPVSAPRADYGPGGAPRAQLGRADRLAALADARLYLCTPVRSSFAAFLDGILAAPGVDLVQVRDKGLEWRDEVAALATALDAAASARLGRDGAGGGSAPGPMVSANDRADLAAATGVDVLHVGQDDIPPAVARCFVGPDVLIGLSTHNPAQLEAAVADPDVDYFCVGPVWATPTKEGRSPVGLDLPRRAALLAPPFAPGAKPWFVTGGVGEDTLDEVLSTGARRVVVVRGITRAVDPASAAASLGRRLRST
jgi:thiamine-phosphate pyrophosphorylase